MYYCDWEAQDFEVKWKEKEKEKEKEKKSLHLPSVPGASAHNH